MMKVFIDTNILIDFLAARKGIKTKNTKTKTKNADFAALTETR